MRYELVGKYSTLVAVYSYCFNRGNKLKISLKRFLILAPFICLISCTDISNKEEAVVTWDATNYTFY